MLALCERSAFSATFPSTPGRALSRGARVRFRARLATAGPWPYHGATNAGGGAGRPPTDATPVHPARETISMTRFHLLAPGGR